MITADYIYHHYQIPDNLQQHMLQAAAVGKITAGAWQADINLQLIVESLLVHDLGNIVKFDLEAKNYQLDEHERGLQFWRQVQTTFQQRYGLRADRANVKVVKELNFSPEIIKLLEKHDFAAIPLALENDEFELQITLYADLRLTPEGLASMSDRINDLRQRYQSVDPKWRDEKSYQQRRQDCLRLEQSINSQTTIDVTQLQSKQVDSTAEKLRSFQFDLDPSNLPDLWDEQQT